MYGQLGKLASCQIRKGPDAHVRAGGHRVAALSAFADTEPAPLRWGELIPLSFLNATLNATALVVLGQPTRRQTDEVAMVPELLALGAALFSHFDALDASVLVVVSGDLAHTHQCNVHL